MALTNYKLLMIVVAIFPLVENAPRNIVLKNAKDDELHTRLVFIDNADDAINSNSQKTSFASSLTPEYQPQSGETRHKSVARAAWPQSDPLLEVKALKPMVLPRMDDERQNWGLVIEDMDLNEDESYYNRPLSLPKKIIKTPTQSDKRIYKEVSITTEVPMPSACDTSIVVCCGNTSKVKECFISHGCINVTDDMFSNLCSRESINRTINDFGKYYKGNQEK